MHKLTVLIAFLLFTFTLEGQNGYEGLVFKSTAHFDYTSFEKKIVSAFSAREVKVEIKPVFRQLDLFVIEGIDEDELDLWKDYLESVDDIIWVVKDESISPRYTPNDIHFDEQWHLERIAAVETWNIARGGLTPNGDTIVLAILDDGFFPYHEDLIENIWFNNGEIPDDDIDNDQNGYVDDFVGLNVLSGNSEHTVKEHGTAVAGVAGAKGDNDIGTVGVSLSVKMMLISEINKISRVIEGYQYVLDMRTKYNETGGSEGAFVVATNLSAGINGVFPDDSPIYQEWCAIYDILGEAGILNVNATTNSNVNIDIEGDMPGTCESEFLLVVTNSDKSDEKVDDAGYGSSSVDMAAPGTEIFTTALSDEYSRFDGASSSAPQVTGAIGLLYNAPCQVFADLSKQNPASSALQIKSMLLDGVDSFSSLSGVVKSGGRLNILTAMSRMRDLCNGTTGDLEIYSIYPNPADDYFRVKFQTENFDLHEFVIFNSIGQLVYHENFYPSYFGEKVYTLVFDNLKLESGVYFASIINDSGIQTIRLLIVGHEE